MKLLQLIRVKEPRRSGGFNTFMVDLIELDVDHFQIRLFKVSEARRTYGVAYGLLKISHHKLDEDGERRERCWEKEFSDAETAQKDFDLMIENWKAEGARIARPRKQKIFS